MLNREKSERNRAQIIYFFHSGKSKYRREKGKQKLVKRKLSSSYSLYNSQLSVPYGTREALHNTERCKAAEVEMRKTRQ